MSFTILLDEPSLERVALPYAQSLPKLGIDVRVRTVDPAQYQQLTDDFDFDMIMMIYPESDSPGNEQRGYLTCAAPRHRAASTLWAFAIRWLTRWSSRSSRRRIARS